MVQCLSRVRGGELSQLGCWTGILPSERRQLLNRRLAEAAAAAVVAVVYYDS